MQAKKSLGQNFLKDPKILKKIADFAQIEKEDLVVEIGPGEGALTEQLLKQAKKVVAIEKDGALVELLKNKFAKEIAGGKLEIIEGDVLKLEAKSLEIGGLNSELLAPSYKLVGNIPYYITGALFKKFLESDHQPRSITFVVQKEVAERILAKDGKESILSISIKAYGEPEFGGIIKAGSFYPKPKVDSAILSIRTISKEKFSSLSTENFSLLEKNFFEILKAGFAHKRKFLLRNLLEAEISGGSFDISKIRGVFKNCGLEEKVRAEDLKIGDWLALTQQLT